MTSQQIRQQFLDFFASKGHAFVPSSPVVPHDDPTLMFTNAGMNQFKPVFLGAARPDHPHVANSQKCIRAGGKHNDLDDVGQDTYHHTFFEMLGNWSFGDYFKKEAIEWAWELLTKVWGIDKSRLHATYFGGKCEVQSPKSKVQNEQSTSNFELRTSDFELEPDYEARDLWLSVTDIDPSRVHPGSMKDNFWEMGETGPCGPCSEIHIDLTPDKSGAALVNKGDARVIELWNLVFIQFNRASNGRLTPLPAKHVDTGMGFERLCAVLQKKTSNYDTDVFAPIFEAIQKRTAAPPYCGTLPNQSRGRKGADGEVRSSKFEVQREHSSIGNRQSAIGNAQVMVDVSYRVIADHLRCLVFALTDGAIPSNEGRGYVLRRILRRAVRYSRQYLSMHEPFLCDLVPVVVEHMAGIFPELRSAHGGKNVQHVAELIRDEETSFIRTLDRGIKLFEEAAEYASGHHHGKISGEDAFKLHDTYGFPVDLTELMAEEQGLTIDVGEYERLMEGARERASRPSKTGAIYTHQLSREMLQQQCRETRFVGYDSLSVDSYLLGVVKGTELSQFSLTLQEGEDGVVILRETPFYAEKGGQVSDKGTITTASGIFEVYDTQDIDGVVVHHGRCVRGIITTHDPKLGNALRGIATPDTEHLGPARAYFETVRAVVQGERRIPTMRNHTSTHILNWALREVLGEHVQQKGSLVDPEKTRFDFSHPKPLTDDELTRIEELVNERIEQGLNVYAEELPLNIAQRINGVRAVFGEKYPDPVRVVSVGRSLDDLKGKPLEAIEPKLTDPIWRKYSVEFCGGTHLRATGEAERFTIISEEGVAKGVRRVVGISGRPAGEARPAGLAMFALVSHRVEAPGDDLVEWLPEFQANLAETVIPVRLRHSIQAMLTVLQRTAREREKEAAASSGQAVLAAVGRLFHRAETIDGVSIVVGEVSTASPDALRGAIDWVRNKTTASAVLLATVEDGKVTMIAGMSRDVVERGVKAGDLIKEICPLVGGKGGGRPDMAQGGGNDPKGLPKALDRARVWIAGKLCG